MIVKDVDIDESGNKTYIFGTDDRVTDVVDALKRSLSWLSSYPGGCAEGCYDQARAAIAKATGEINEP